MDEFDTGLDTSYDPYANDYWQQQEEERLRQEEEERRRQEEERRQQEEEARNAEIQKQELVTRADGSQEHTVTTSIPPGGTAASVQVPGAPEPLIEAPIAPGGELGVLARGFQPERAAEQLLPLVTEKPTIGEYPPNLTPTVGQPAVPEPLPPPISVGRTPQPPAELPAGRQPSGAVTMPVRPQPAIQGRPLAPINPQDQSAAEYWQQEAARNRAAGGKPLPNEFNIFGPKTGQAAPGAPGVLEGIRQNLTGFVNGERANLGMKPLAYAPGGGQAGAAAGQPVDYNARIAQLESGGNPSIGYHYKPDETGKRASSAYGAYGITADTYKGIQRLDPYFRDRDITSLSLDEQTRANDVLTQANGRSLEKYGQPVNSGTLALAHFLGAKGANDYLTSGYISPQAAAANGGEAKVKAIADQRLSMGGPASGALQAINQAAPGAPGAALPGGALPFRGGQPGYDEAGTPIQANGMPGTPRPVTPIPAITDQLGSADANLMAAQRRLQEVQGNSKGLQDFIADPNAPVHLKQAAQDQLNAVTGQSTTPEKTAEQVQLERFQQNQNNPLELLKHAEEIKDSNPGLAARMRARAGDVLQQTKTTATAKSEVDSMIANNDTRGISKTLATEPKNSFAGAMRASLLSYLGLHKAADEEINRWGDYGKEWKPAMDANGNSAIIEYDSRGKPLSGIKSDGSQLGAKELVSYAAQDQANMKTAQTQATHAYQSTYSNLMKKRDEYIADGADEADLKQRGLDEATIRTKASEAGRAVLTAARTNYSGFGAAPAAAPAAPAGAPLGAGTTITPGGATTAAAPAPAAAPKAAPKAAPTEEETGIEKSEVLKDWNKFRPSETPAQKTKRTALNADDLDAYAQGLVNGDMTFKEMTGVTGIHRSVILQRAKELDPTFKVADADIRKRAREMWTTKTSGPGAQVQAHITASESMSEVRDYFDALKNGDIVAANKIANYYNNATGKEAFIQAKTGMMLLGPEIIKSIIPSGGGVTERKAAEDLVNPSLSPKQIAASFKVLEDFQGNALKSLENRWTSAKLPKDQFKTTMLGGSPAAQDLLDRASQSQANRAARQQGLPAAPPREDIEAEMRRRGLLK